MDCSRASIREEFAKTVPMCIPKHERTLGDMALGDMALGDMAERQKIE